MGQPREEGAHDRARDRAGVHADAARDRDVEPRRDARGHVLDRDRQLHACV